jgi:hypothetical protein
MSSPLRLISFGDATGDVWGAAIDAGDPALLLATADGITSSASAQFQLDTDQAAWRLSGEDFELLVAPLDGGGTNAPGGGSARDELCRVEGTLEGASGQRAVSCSATRSVGTDPGVLAGGGSVRGLSGWFTDNRGLCLHALRGRNSPGQDQDEIAATLFDPEQWVAVSDPRLSTTFRPQEQPERASVELWVGDDGEQYPRRAVAEATGPALHVQSDGVRMQVTPMRCHSEGLDGAGVYLIAYL